MARRLKLSPFPQLSEEPPSEILFCSPWAVESAQGTNAKHWDYEVDLVFRRTLRLNPAKLRSEVGLSDKATVALFAEWSTSLSTYARGRGPIIELKLDASELRDVGIEVPVQGTECGGILKLHTQLALLKEPDPQLGGPVLTGSLLWEGEDRQLLESPGARLPVCVVDFSEFADRFQSDRAAWAVVLTTEALEQPPSVGMQIYLNSSWDDLVDQLTRTENSGQASLAKRMLFLDVGRQLVQRVIKNETFCDPDHTFPERSLGAALRRRFRLIFGKLSLAEISSMAEHEPAEFEIRIQGGLMGSP